MSRLVRTALLALLPLAVAAPAVAAPPAGRPEPGAIKPQPEAAPHLLLVGGKIHIGDGNVIADGWLEIEDGRIKATGKGAPPSVAGATTVDVKGKWLTPGLVAAESQLGLVEIELESSTRDDQRKAEHHVRAGYDPADAINTESSLLQIQAVEGVTSAVVAPGGGLFSGQGAWLDLRHGAHSDAVARRGVSVSARLGHAFAGSRAATLAEMKRVLIDAREYQRRKGAHERRQMRDLAAHPADLEALQPVLAGKVPLMVRAHRASDILALLALGKEFKLRVVVVGGAEAWKVRDHLAEAKVPVVLTPSKNLPGSFDQLGARLENAALLAGAGVEVVIADIGGAHNLRNLTQEAGIAVAYGLPYGAALAAVTLNAARVYGMDKDYGSLEAGKVANVVVWPGDPFELSNWPDQVYVQGRPIPMRSRQTLLRDRYLERHGLGAHSK